MHFFLAEHTNQPILSSQLKNSGSTRLLSGDPQRIGLGPPSSSSAFFDCIRLRAWLPFRLSEDLQRGTLSERDSSRNQVSVCLRGSRLAHYDSAIKQIRGVSGGGVGVLLTSSSPPVPKCLQSASLWLISKVSHWHNAGWMCPANRFYPKLRFNSLKQHRFGV